VRGCGSASPASSKHIGAVMPSYSMQLDVGRQLAPGSGEGQSDRQATGGLTRIWSEAERTSNQRAQAAGPCGARRLGRARWRTIRDCRCDDEALGP
jgi:hypothetical protein